jgi:hypothetical protein
LNFYETCAEILGTSYNCEGFYFHYRTRWNNRSPGHGRFPGYGTIRKFGNVYQIALRHPVEHIGTYYSEEEVFKRLKILVSS